MNNQTKASGISAGIFLISLAVLILTGWWWPGIMLAIGLAGGARLAFEGQYSRALIVFGIFTAIPLLMESEIPWVIVVPVILVSLGVVALVKAFLLRDNK